jgi:uncharacterized protein YbjT (DUF2867 family)
MTRVAVTGASGFVGSHTARALLANGDDVVLVARHSDTAAIRTGEHATWIRAGIDDESALAHAFAGCDSVIHCAGINLERGAQTYGKVHVRGTRTVVRAATAAGVPRIALVSFLRARPACGSAYHESKWAAEEIVRYSGLTYTVLKAGVIYGSGDHMLDHLSRALRTFPMFPLVGFGSQRRLRPVAVEDVARVLVASVHEQRLNDVTVPVLGPDELTLTSAVQRVAVAIGCRPAYMRAPVALHRVLAWVLERVMTVPLVSAAQVRILAEGIVEPALAPQLLPADLVPTTPYSEESIRAGLPADERFSCADLRMFHRAA